MSKNNFTQGEWVLNDAGEVLCGSYLICNMVEINKEDIANGHLIAAAPEMYKFIKKCSAAFGADYPALKETADNLLSKVRGENKN